MWVLIVLVVHTGGFAAMTSVDDFRSQEACEAAAAQWRKDFNGSYGVKALCHPKRI